jgi:hypothetical protein
MASELGEDGKLVFRSLFCCDPRAIKRRKNLTAFAANGFRWFRRLIRDVLLQLSSSVTKTERVYSSRP